MASDVRMGERVAHMGTVAFAVWQVLQDRRHRLLFGVQRQPESGRQPRAVGQGDPAVGDFVDFAREGSDGFHAVIPVGVASER